MLIDYISPHFQMIYWACCVLGLNVSKYRIVTDFDLSPFLDSNIPIESVFKGQVNFFTKNLSILSVKKDAFKRIYEEFHFPPYQYLWSHLMRLFSVLDLLLLSVEWTWVSFLPGASYLSPGRYTNNLASLGPGEPIYGVPSLLIHERARFVQQLWPILGCSSLFFKLLR